MALCHEEQFVGQIDTTEEDETLSQHMDTYEEAESLTQHLINVSTAMSIAISLRSQMSDVETMMADSTDKSFDLIMTDVKLEFKALKTLLQRATIPPDHQVQHLLTTRSSTCLKVSGRR